MSDPNTELEIDLAEEQELQLEQSINILEHKYPNIHDIDPESEDGHSVKELLSLRQQLLSVRKRKRNLQDDLRNASAPTEMEPPEDWGACELPAVKAEPLHTDEAQPEKKQRADGPGCTVMESLDGSDKKNVIYNGFLLPTPDVFNSLSRDQQAALFAVVRGDNVVISGEGGSGKSHLIKVIKDMCVFKNAAFTATTGIAGINIGGPTINSFLGFFGDHLNASLTYGRKNKEKKQELRDLDLHLTDEVSMMTNHVLDFEEQLMRLAKSSTAAFGGMQRILVGDFLQLPPVTKESDYAFNAKCWSRCAFTVVVLRHVYRQSDAEFLDVLASVRTGTSTPKHELFLKQLENTQFDTSNGIIPTDLSSTRADVSTINLTELDKLPGDALVFEAKDGCQPGQDNALKEIQKNCPAKEKITLKIGAQVVLLRNLNVSQGLCNGSRGVVVGWEMESDSEIVSIGKIGAVKAKLVPIVRFTNGMVIPITHAAWNREKKEELLAWRKQIPLDLAWALTIHKSQSLTMDAVQIRVPGMFSVGQFYVALSRARCKSGVKLVGFTKLSIKTCPRAVQWYKQQKDKSDELLKWGSDNIKLQ